MSNRLVCDREFAEVVTDHLGLNLNLIEHLAAVNTDHRSNHFRENNHVSEVGLDHSRSFVRAGGKLGGTQLLHQS